MLKFFGLSKKKGGGADEGRLSKASSELSLSSPGYVIREKYLKDLSKLHKAAWIGDLNKVKQFAKKDASPLDKENRTPLHLACVKGHSAIVQELLEWKAKTNIVDSESRTPLLKAVQCHQLQCVQLLLESRADPNTQDAVGETCLHYAARDGVIMILEILLQCGKINIDIQSKDGNTAMMVATLAQQVRSIKMLLQNGADPDLQDLRGRTALMLACNADDAEIVRLLLDGKSSFVIKDVEGWTAIDLAEKAGNRNSLKVLSRYTTQSPIAHKKLTAALAESEDEIEVDKIGDGAAAAAVMPAPQRLNNGALKPPSFDEDEAIFGMPAANEAGDFSAAEDTESKASESAGALDSWNDSEEDSLFETKKKSKQSVEAPIDARIAQIFKLDSNSDTDLSNLLKKSENGTAKDLGRVSSSNSATNLTTKVSNEQVAPVSARSAASVGSLGTWSDDDESLFSSLKEKKPSLLRPPSAFSNNAPPPAIAPKPSLEIKLPEDEEDKWSDSEISPIAKKPGTTPFSTFKPTNTPATAVEAKVAEEDADDKSNTSKWDESPEISENTSSNNRKFGMSSKPKKANTTAQAVEAEVAEDDADDVKSNSSMSDKSQDIPKKNNGMLGMTFPQKKANTTAQAVEAEVAEEDADDNESNTSKWSESQDKPKNTSRILEMTAQQKKAMMAELGLADDVSEVSDPEFSDDETDGQNAYAPSAKKKDDSEWDSTQASGINTPAVAKAKEPPMSARSIASEWDSIDEQPPLPENKRPFVKAVATKKNLPDEDGDYDDVVYDWDSEDELPFGEDEKPAVKVLVTSDAPVKPRVIGGMNADFSDEDTDEKEKEKTHQEKLREAAEEERLKRIQTMQEKLRQEAHEEMRLLKEKKEREKMMKAEAEKTRIQRPEIAKKEQEEREKMMKAEAEKRRIELAEIEKKEQEERDKMIKAEAEKIIIELAEIKKKEQEERDKMIKAEAEKVIIELAEIKKKEQEERDKKTSAEQPVKKERFVAMDTWWREEKALLDKQQEEERIQERRLSIEKAKEEERKELERKQEEDRTIEEMILEEKRQAEIKKKSEEVKDTPAKDKASLSSPGVNKQPKKEGPPAVPPKPRGAFFPSPRENLFHRKDSIPEEDEDEVEDDDDTFNNDQIPDISSPGRPTDTMIGLTSAVSLPPSGFHPMMNGTGVNGHAARNDNDDCLSYSSTEHDISDHNGGLSLGLGNSANLSFGSDSMGMLRQQEQLREARRLLDKERSQRVTLENKKRNIESERSEVVQKLEDVTRAKSSLEQEKIKMEATIRALEYDMGQEEAKRKNAETLYNKTKEQLARKEEQYTGEAEARQKAELNMRNMQMELRTVLSQVKQLEDEKEDLNRQFQHEKNARLLQEQINEELTNFQKSLTENKVSDQRLQEEMTEMMSKFEEANENRKHAQDSVEKLQADLYALKMELERQRNRARDDHNLLASENDDLLTKIEDLKADLKLNEDALNQATVQYNINLSQMKVENTRVVNNWEKERETREKLESDVQSLNARLEASAKELKIMQEARSDLERQNHKNTEDLTKLLERREHELTVLKEAKENFQQKVNTAETKLSIQENELHMINATLTERSNQVAKFQQDLEQRKSAFETLDGNYRKEKENSVRLQARFETMQEKLSSLEQEVPVLRQQNDDLRTQNFGKDQKETQERVSSMLQSLRDEHERARIALEEKNANLNETISELKENIRNTTSRQGSDSQELRNLQQELKEVHKELSSAQASLEVTNRTKELLEMDKKSLQAEIERLQNRLEASQQKQTEFHTQLLEVTNKLERAEHSSALTNKQLVSHTATAEADAKSREDFIHQIHQLELVKTRLESALDHESQKVEMLQRELQDANQTLDSLQEQVSLLRSSNSELQHQIEHATAAQTQANNEAQDNKGLWEAEVKARSKIGLRIAQLEREKQEVLAQVDEEKKKTRKALELKKVAETKLNGEEGKTDLLQKELTAIKIHLKNAKKKMKDNKDTGVTQTAQEQEMRAMDNTITALRQQLLDSTKELSQEKMKRMDFETKHRHASQRNVTLIDMNRNFGRLEKAKRKTEEEFAAYKAHVANNYVEKAMLDKKRAELEAELRIELNQKLETVNSHLQQQSDSRHYLDQMRDSTMDDMKREFEKTKREMREEIHKLKNSYNGNLKKDDWEVQKYKDLYDSEFKLRERLQDKLLQATERATQAQTLVDRHKAMMNSSFGSPMHNGYGNPFPNGLVSSSHRPPPRDDMSYKLRDELDRSVHKHMERGPKMDISVPSIGRRNLSGLAAAYDTSSLDYLDVLKSSYSIK